jgi:hypothetical protein
MSTTEGGHGMAQQFMGKLTANERMALYGALIVFVLSLIGTSWLTLILSAGVIVVYYLKYSPTSNIAWPIQPELINLVLSGIIGLLAVLGLLGLFAGAALLGGLGGGVGLGLFGGIFLIAVVLVILNAVGAFLMVRGTWREYQAMPKATTPAPPAPPAA